jgi:hypothetical protein
LYIFADFVEILLTGGQKRVCPESSLFLVSPAGVEPATY